MTVAYCNNNNNNYDNNYYRPISGHTVSKVKMLVMLKQRQQLSDSLTLTN